MYLFHVLRSFLPLHNPIGFGASDFIEFAFAAFLVLLVLARAWLEPAAQALARRTGWCMLFLAALVIVLRLALLPVHPVPTASRHRRLQLPASGRYPGALPAGEPHSPHAPVFRNHLCHSGSQLQFHLSHGSGAFPGVGPVGFRPSLGGRAALRMALFCALCFWMLRGWTTPGWALAGGLLAVCEFGPLNMWMNCYWGGAVSAMRGLPGVWRIAAAAGTVRIRVTPRC